MLAVLHVSQPTEAGVARIAADLARGQVERGWRVAVASPAAGALPEWARAAGATHLDWAASRAPGPTVGAEVRRLRRCIESFRPDVLHLHSSKAGLAGRLLTRGRSPAIFEPNAWSFEALTGPAAAAARVWERRGARWCDAIVCVSEAERDLGVAAGIRAAWRVIPNGVDLEMLMPATAQDRSRARAELGIEDVPTVVCVGRLSRQKGQDWLLDAWPGVVRRVANARLYLVGDGPERQSLEAHSVPAVRFVGQRDDVPKWLAASDVVVMPSRWEGCSLAMLEAMARARSVVATDVSGAREAIDGDAGAVITIEDATALTAALADRLLDPSLVDDEGRAGRARMEERHDLRATEDAIARLYGEVLAARS
jgi:glycosyltransferase involved in cell wall biosynthesis